MIWAGHAFSGIVEPLMRRTKASKKQYIVGEQNDCNFHNDKEWDSGYTPSAPRKLHGFSRTWCPTMERTRGPSFFIPEPRDEELLLTFLRWGAIHPSTKGHTNDHWRNSPRRCSPVIPHLSPTVSDICPNPRPRRIGSDSRRWRRRRHHSGIARLVLARDALEAKSERRINETLCEFVVRMDADRPKKLQECNTVQVHSFARSIHSNRSLPSCRAPMVGTKPTETDGSYDFLTERMDSMVG